MGKYTTITLRREVVEELEGAKRELGAKSLGEAISMLVAHWRRVKASEFAEKVKKARERGGLEEVRKAVEELRKLRWAKFT